MLNMIKADLYRVLRSKIMYIALFLILFATSLSLISMQVGHIGLASVTKEADIKIEDKKINQELKETNNISESRKIMHRHTSFPLDQQIIGTNINLYYVFIFIVGIVITLDFSSSTIKNTLSSAISRKQYYLSKLSTCLILGTFLILINNSYVYFANLIINGSKFSSSIIDVIFTTLIQLPMLYASISILMCIACITRKNATYNGIAIPFIIIIQLIITTICSIFGISANTIMQYEFQSALLSLSTHPTTNFILVCSTLGLSYVMIFNIIGYYFLKHAEIK